MTMRRNDATDAAGRAWQWWSGVHAQLAALRNIAGMTQRELAEAIGTRQGNVGMDEKHRARPEDLRSFQMTRAIRWLDAIGVEVVLCAPDSLVWGVYTWPGPTPHLLRSLRDKAGLSRAELAELTDVAPDTIYQIEKNGADTRITTLAALAIALDWPPKIRAHKRPVRQCPECGPHLLVSHDEGGCWAKVRNGGATESCQCKVTNQQ